MFKKILTLFICLNIITCVSSCTYIDGPYYDTPKAAWAHSEESNFEEPNREIVKEIDTINFGDLALYVFIDNFGDIAVTEMYVKKQGEKNTYILGVSTNFYDLDRLSSDFDLEYFPSMENKTKVVYDMRLKDNGSVIINGVKAKSTIYQVDLQGEIYNLELWYTQLEHGEKVEITIK